MRGVLSYCRLAWNLWRLARRGRRRDDAPERAGPVPRFLSASVLRDGALVLVSAGDDGRAGVVRRAQRGRRRWRPVRPSPTGRHRVSLRLLAAAELPDGAATPHDFGLPYAVVETDDGRARYYFGPRDDMTGPLRDADATGWFAAEDHSAAL